MRRFSRERLSALVSRLFAMVPKSVTRSETRPIQREIVVSSIARSRERAQARTNEAFEASRCRLEQFELPVLEVFCSVKHVAAYLIQVFEERLDFVARVFAVETANKFLVASAIGLID